MKEDPNERSPKNLAGPAYRANQNVTGRNPPPNAEVSDQRPLDRGCAIRDRTRPLSFFCAYVRQNTRSGLTHWVGSADPLDPVFYLRDLQRDLASEVSG